MAFDTNLMLRAAAACTTSEQADAGKDFGGPDHRALTYVVKVPSVSGTGTPTLALKIQESTDGSTWVDFLAFPDITAAGTYMVTGRSDRSWRRFYSTVTGTNPNFGSVSIGVRLGGRYTKF